MAAKYILEWTSSAISAFAGEHIFCYHQLDLVVVAHTSLGFLNSHSLNYGSFKLTADDVSKTQTLPTYTRTNRHTKPQPLGPGTANDAPFPTRHRHSPAHPPRTGAPACLWLASTSVCTKSANEHNRPRLPVPALCSVLLVGRENAAICARVTA